MKKVLSTTVILGYLCCLAACGGSPVKGKHSGGGSLYSDVQFNERTGDNALGGKRGEGCTSNILGIFASGDASAASAAKQAGITKVSAVDGTASNILGLYTTYCVVVVGE